MEDATGKVWLDPTDAEFHLLPDAEYSTEKRQPSREVRERLEKLGLSPEQLEQRLRDFYEQHVRTQRGLPRQGEANPIGLNPEAAERIEKAGWLLAEEAKKEKLRFSEKNLLPGDPVYVMGPAYAVPDAEQSAIPVKIQKVHPDDPFLVGEGSPEEVRKRLRQSALQTGALGAALAVGGLALVVSCVT